MTAPEVPTSAEEDAAHFKAARSSLIATLRLYGVHPDQAEIQVDSLIEAARKTKVEST